MYGGNLGAFGGYPAQAQPYPNAAAQRAYQQIGAAGPVGYQQPQNPNPGFVWVQGEAAARSFMVAPGATVLLMDSDSTRFYIKSADPSGMPSMRVFEYTEVDPNAARQQPAQDMTAQYVTREEYNTLATSYQELAGKLDRLMTEKRGRKAAVNDEESSL